MPNSYRNLTVLLALIIQVHAVTLDGLVGFWTWGVWVVAFGGLGLIITGIALCIICCAKQRPSRGRVINPQTAAAVVVQQQQYGNTAAGYPVGTQSYSSQAYGNPAYSNQAYPTQGYSSQDTKDGYGQPPVYGAMNPQYGQPPPYGPQATFTQPSQSATGPHTQTVPQPTGYNDQTPTFSSQPQEPAEATEGEGKPPMAPANIYN